MRKFKAPKFTRPPLASVRAIDAHAELVCAFEEMTHDSYP